ncbi:MAG: NADH-quinone oxidoreductase subunit NuoF [Bacillota bacterium]
MRRILLCNDTGCKLSGAKNITAKLAEEIKKQGIDHKYQIVNTGCHGFCEQGPIVVIEPEDTFYCKVKEKDVEEIVAKHLVNNEIVERLLFEDPLTKTKIEKYQDIIFYAKQEKIVLQRCGLINPLNINEYLQHEGYKGLEKALSISPIEVVNEIKAAGLRGRGGAGFPTGLKWEFAHKAVGDKKYIVCNADEGDPGAFMDRGILEGDPHSLIEGMLIAAYAIGSDEGYIYVRAEYPSAIRTLKIAMEQATAKGFLGDKILGTEFSFHLKIKEGAGAFVCGEETALLASIEGKRGMPRVRPPFPAQKGLWGKPTNINNVETFANVANIIRNGAQWYSSIGTEKSKGTKIFALSGKVKNTGLVEVPMGITLREIIFDIGGGIQGGKEFKAVQIGGPSGGCLTNEHLDLPIDYDSLLQVGAMMGSGGLVVMDQDTCMVDVARFFLNFTQSESCGKCTPCREGTKRMLEILTRITEGEGKEEDILKLETLGKSIKVASLCGLGQTAPNPVLSTLKYFRHEYEAHIKEKRCPAVACKELVTYTIDPVNCNGCTLCARRCPADAITGKLKEVHVIDQYKCTKCNTCFEVCRFDAVIKS